MEYSIFPFVPFIYAINSVNRNGSAYTKDGMITGLKDSIIRNSNETFVTECCSFEISWIIMIATYKYNPIVGLIHSLGISSNHLLIVFFLFKAKTTIPSYNQ